MSPEQIAGSHVDHRTDIFSLGVILSETLAGHRPFQGQTQIELAASIMRDPPPRITRADAPDGLMALIEQCRVKGVGERMQSARSLASRLRAITPSSLAALESARFLLDPLVLRDRPWAAWESGAAQALRELDAVYPDFGSHARQELEKWFVESAHVEHMLEGVRKAGLKLAEGGPGAF
jgi:serine/threonine protein kinase